MIQIYVFVLLRDAADAHGSASKTERRETEDQIDPLPGVAAI